jgi:hypothetical protein
MPALLNDNFRAVTRAAAGLLIFATAACSSGITDPDGSRASAKKGGKKQRDLVVESPVAALPAFLFVSDASGAPQLYRFRNDTVVRLTFTDMPDVNPHVRGSSVVFASYRDGDGEIYFGDSELRSVRRLVGSPSTDDEPSLSPARDRIAFTSYRTGVSRIFTMDTTGSSQVELETGASSNVPETRPSWSPDGARIAFASSRTGTSQIFVVSENGGVATQLTHESVGAFDPVFSEDGTQIIYTAWLNTARLRVITLATGAIADYVTGSLDSIGEGDCDAEGCLATANPYSSDGDIVHVDTFGTRRTLVARIGHDSRASRLDR